MTDPLSSEHLFEHAACGLLVADSKGTIQKINSTLCTWLGIEKCLLVNVRRVQDFLTVGGRVFHQTHCVPLLQMQGSVAEVQMDMVHREGHRIQTLMNIIRRPFEDTYYDEWAIFVATDRRKYEKELLLARQASETALKQLRGVQKELQESQDVLGLAMRGAKMGVWTKNLKTSYLWCSREMEELAGLAEGVLSNNEPGFHALIHADDRQLFFAAMDNAITTMSDYLVEFRFKHSDGGWRVMEGRGAAKYDDKNQAETLFGVIIDVTERQRVDEQLRQLNDQLSLADRRKDEFLATLAHELRNPLAPLRNVLEILGLRQLNDPELVWMRDVFERQVAQITHLVDDLMEVSRITQGRLELRMAPLNLSEIMQGAAEAMHFVMDSYDHVFTLTLPPEPIFLNADATRLTQVISNLLANAAKYTPEGGVISLSAAREDGFAVLTVRDSGIGIAEENLEHVFEMFSQLKPALERSEGGLGIGLSLVHGIVKLHGGTVYAKSDGLNKGSEFIVRLPIDESLPLTAESSAVSLSALQGGQRILIIDDNVDAADTLSVMFELLGYVVKAEHSGASGYMSAQAFRPDFILLDIGLPDMTGYDVARRIRGETWGTNIVIIAATGWGQAKDRELAKDAGFDHHLTKPINFAELEKILKSAL